MVPRGKVDLLRETAEVPLPRAFVCRIPAKLRTGRQSRRYGTIREKIGRFAIAAASQESEMKSRRSTPGVREIVNAAADSRRIAHRTDAAITLYGYLIVSART